MWKHGSTCELILGIIILVFALWETAWSSWIVVIAAIVLIIHSMTCRVCFPHRGGDMAMKSAIRRKRR